MIQRACKLGSSETPGHVLATYSYTTFYSATMNMMHYQTQNTQYQGLF
jgi:hypothetical protein